MRRTFGESRRSGRLAVAALALLALLSAPQARADDRDAFGGLFRTLDAGANWSPINPGIFASGALALAVSPRDESHLLLATDSGAWRSRNAGRDWTIEAPDILTGPAVATAFDLDGVRALMAGVETLFRFDGDDWRAVSIPSGAAPVRALAAAPMPGRVYLAGRAGLYRSDDWGRSWASIGSALRAEHVDQVVVVTGSPDEVRVLAGGTVWSTSDAGRTWRPRGEGFAGAIEAIGTDPSKPQGLWAVVGGQILHSPRPGEPWGAVGTPLPERTARSRALAIMGDVIVMATDQGLFRTPDAGGRWDPPRRELPGHLIAGTLVSDPRHPATLYAGFALTSYDQLREWVKPGAAPASSAPAYRSTMLVLAGLLALGAIAGAVSLARARSAARAGPASIGRTPQ